MPQVEMAQVEETKRHERYLEIIDEGLKRKNWLDHRKDVFLTYLYTKMNWEKDSYDYLTIEKYVEVRRKNKLDTIAEREYRLLRTAKIDYDKVRVQAMKAEEAYISEVRPVVCWPANW